MAPVRPAATSIVTTAECALELPTFTSFRVLIPATGTDPHPSWFQRTTPVYDQVTSLCVPEDGCSFNEPMMGFGVLCAYVVVTLGECAFEEREQHGLVLDDQNLHGANVGPRGGSPPVAGAAFFLRFSERRGPGFF